jgi:hypothetical protein
VIATTLRTRSGLRFFILENPFVVSVAADTINRSFFYPTNSII